LDDQIVQIEPIHAEFGYPITASQQAVASLRNGTKTNGILLVATQTSLRIFKPATSKGAQKSLDNYRCLSAAVSRCEDRGHALVILCDDGCARAYSIPGLREIASARVSNILDSQRFSDAVITRSGDIYGWASPSETALINIWGSGLVL
jgi:syntaxin-binding protein 5